MRNQNKFDVVIPTILNTDPAIFSWTLKQLQECILVNKIIIIDNTETQDFKPEYCAWLDSYKKIEVINGYTDELYVNGAWNVGIEFCESAYYIILNDDILMSKEIVFALEQITKLNPHNLMTVQTINDIGIDEYVKKMEYYSIKITDKIPNGRQGWIMSGRVSEWVPIPKGLKIFYGDDWIYYQVRKRGGSVGMITGNMFVSHFQSSSVNSNFARLKPIIDQDGEVWRNLNERR